MVKIVWATIRGGKSSYVTASVQERLNGDFAFNSILRSRTKVTGKMGKTVPTDNLVYANFAIHGGLPGLPPGSSHVIDTRSGRRFGVPNDEFETHYFPPFSTIIVDEAHKHFPSGTSNRLPRATSEWFEVSGQNGYDIVLISQRLMHINIDIRDLCTEFIHISSIKNYGKYGKPLPRDEEFFGDELYATKWQGRLFKGSATAEAHDKDPTGCAYGEPWSYTYRGNVFDRYNSFEFSDIIHDGNDGRDFDR